MDYGSKIFFIIFCIKNAYYVAYKISAFFLISYFNQVSKRKKITSRYFALIDLETDSLVLDVQNIFSD